MIIQEHISLLPYNTFHLDEPAQYFAEVQTMSELHDCMQSSIYKNNAVAILGGGSNILLTKPFSGLMLRVQISGIALRKEDADNVWIRVGAGEPWHPFVAYCVEKGYGGIENLSLIPGCVGATPIQNIGAYGVEVKQVIHNVEAVHRVTGQKRVFSNEECRFGYRDSIFKQEQKDLWIITHVEFRLSKKPKLEMSYGAIAAELDAQHLKPSIQNISAVVMHIRRQKLPDPVVLGNSGSFFKNPVIDTTLAAKLKAQYPNLPEYPHAEGQTKIAAGWLIEQCGWRGKRVGNCGAYKDQALVLVNYGGATGAEVWKLAQEIQASVHNRFGVAIEPEVNVW